MSEIISNIIDLTKSSGGGAVINNEDITVTTNGVYTAGDGYTGLGNVTVNVAVSQDRLATAEVYKMCAEGAETIIGINENGIVSGISAVSFLQYPFLVKNSDWELVVNGIFYGNNNSWYGPVNLLCVQNKFIVFVKKENYVYTARLADFNSVGQWTADYIGVSSLQKDIYYCYKLTFNNTTKKLTLYVSADGENYTQEVEIEKNMDLSGILNIGQVPFRGNDSTNQWGGRIDLSKSYLKIGDTMYPFFRS